MKLKDVNFQKATIKSPTIEVIEINNQGVDYKLNLGKASEIGMNNYVFNKVDFSRNEEIILSGEMNDPLGNYKPNSHDSNFIYIPFNHKTVLINLKTNKQLEASVEWFSDNIFNNSSSKMIINGVNEFKVIDLENMKEIYHDIDEESYISKSCFINDDLIWKISPRNQILEINTKTSETKLIEIESPFKKYGIEIKPYQSLIDSKSYSLFFDDNRIENAINLNTWKFVNIDTRIILETIIPTSGILKLKEIDASYCKVQYKYAEVENTSANFA